MRCFQRIGKCFASQETKKKPARALLCAFVLNAKLPLYQFTEDSRWIFLSIFQVSNLCYVVFVLSVV